jgi:DHA1 family bicyclomycin/chloramphenicol resistance-like MFS transporter
LATTAAGVTGLAVLITLLFLTFAGLGLVIPTTMVLALEDHGPIAGMAAALAGTLQMLTGAGIIAAVSVFFDGTALPMVTTIALCAVAAFVLSQSTLRTGKMIVKPAE